MGEIYVAGRNADYDLGLGDATQRNTHTQLAGDWLVVRSSSGSGGKFGMGIKADGTLWAWGNNTYKQLGLSSASYTTPTQVGSGTTWTDLALGDYHTLALKSDGTLWASGLNSSGQCGMGNATSPVNGFTQVGSGTTWSHIAAGGSCSFAIKADGSLWACGENYGQLGIGTTSAYEHTFTREATSSSLWAEIKTLLSFSLARRTDGTLWSWGIDTYGETGQGATGTYSSPTQIGSGTDWAAIAAGTNTAYATKTGGTLWAAGRGQYYALGTGNTTDQTSLVQIGSATDWDSVAAGNQFMLALKTSGVPWVVGRNVFGVLGTGNTTDVTTLTALSPAYAPNGVSAGANATILTVGFSGERGTFSAPVTMNVIARVHGTFSGPVTMTVTPLRGTFSAPARMSVTASDTFSGPVRMSVVDTLLTTAWKVSATLDGTDYSARLTGVVSIDAEENAARTADFTLHQPKTGSALSLIAWLGASVKLALIRVIGAAEIPTRLFTGVVEIAQIDPVTRLIKFHCHDDLKNRVANQTRAALDGLTANSLNLGYSPAALGEVSEDNWDYAQARMECVAGCLDADRYGGIRVTPFAGSVAWSNTFTIDSPFDDASFSLELPQRSDIINQVDVTFEYRLHRCRERRAYIAWANTIFGPDSFASSYQSPTMQAVTAAVAGTGWEVLHLALTRGFAYVVADSTPFGLDPGNWWYVGTDNACGSMHALLGQRHAQPFTETYQIGVRADASIATYGNHAQAIRGALSSDWEPGNWESDWTITTPDASTSDVDYAGTMTRTVADDAIQTLLLRARKIILGSHRTGRVSFRIPCLPELELIHSATLDTTPGAATDCVIVQATGKVARLRHEIDIDQGTADTVVTLAMLGVGAVGSVTDDSLATPPAPPVWGPGPDDGAAWVTDPWDINLPNLSRHVGAVTNHTWTDALQGYLVNAPEQIQVIDLTTGATVANDNPYYAAAWGYPETGFKITMPGVADNYREAPLIDAIVQTRTLPVATATPLTLT